MTLLKQIFILALCVSPLIGFTQEVTYNIDGKVNPKYNGRTIRLLYTTDKGVKVADSTKINKGSFTFEGKLERPLAGKITLGTEDKGDRIDLFLGGGKVVVTTKDSIRYAKINGNKMVESYEKLAKIIRPMDDKFYTAMFAINTMPEGEARKAYVAKVLSGLDVYLFQKREAIHRFVLENTDSYISLYSLDKNSPKGLLNYEATNPYYSRLSKSLQETPLGKDFGERLVATKGKLTGEKFIDFVSTTPEGKQLSLKEVLTKNKYTLVDFWASWCAPCRKENPNVVKTYDAFKDKGFTVLSVSLDDNATKWKAAIEVDGMPWYHVSSLKGWKEPVAALYNIRAIPENVLVDANGKIVATNLRAETLYNKVQELLK